MAMPVVDRLEMIQVEQHQRAGSTFPAQACRLRHGEADEAPAIGDAEKRIGGGQPVQFPVGGPQGLQLLSQGQGIRRLPLRRDVGQQGEVAAPRHGAAGHQQVHPAGALPFELEAVATADRFLAEGGMAHRGPRAILARGGNALDDGLDRGKGKHIRRGHGEGVLPGVVGEGQPHLRVGHHQRLRQEHQRLPQEGDGFQREVVAGPPVARRSAVQPLDQPWAGWGDLRVRGDLEWGCAFWCGDRHVIPDSRGGR